MRTLDASAYFAARAPRYQEALRACPTARALDYVPYLAAMEAAGFGDLNGRVACDAFGGTGFLARGFSRLGIRTVVADVCEQMLTSAAGSPEVQTHVSRDDFRSVATAFGEEAFDFVFSHGGLHHVLEGSDDVPDVEASRLRQSGIVARLARLVRPGGILVLADIPDQAPEEHAGVLRQQVVPVELLEKCCKGGLGRLGEMFGGRAVGWSLADVEDAVAAQLWQPVGFPVPRHFFDDFIAVHAPMGHIAVYPAFDELATVLAEAGLRLLGRVNYRGPWRFANPSEAGWFFREKFSLFEPCTIGADPTTERRVFESASTFLGARSQGPITAVNWGVTYAVYQAPS